MKRFWLALLLMTLSAAPIPAMGDEVPSLTIDLPAEALLMKGHDSVVVPLEVRCEGFLSTTFLFLAVTIEQKHGKSINTGRELVVFMQPPIPLSCDGSRHAFMVEVPAGSVDFHGGKALVIADGQVCGPTPAFPDRNGCTGEGSSMTSGTVRLAQKP